jgi:hypothetical protein
LPRRGGGDREIAAAMFEREEIEAARVKVRAERKGGQSDA